MHVGVASNPYRLFITSQYPRFPLGCLEWPLFPLPKLPTTPTELSNFLLFPFAYQEVMTFADRPTAFTTLFLSFYGTLWHHSRLLPVSFLHSLGVSQET